MNIVFMGTPDYAVKTLEAVINAGHFVSAVFAQPDKPVGRKHILTAPQCQVCIYMMKSPLNEILAFFCFRLSKLFFLLRIV